MSQKRPFSKLKKVIDSLFDSQLKMEVCCTAYPVRGQWGRNHLVPRFYIKIGKTIIWDFPKDFQIKEVPFHLWADSNNITNLLRDYIDTPLAQLLEKEFAHDTNKFITGYTGAEEENNIVIRYRLTELLKAADRRLGEERLRKWAQQVANPKVDQIIALRFGQSKNGDLTLKGG